MLTAKAYAAKKSGTTAKGSNTQIVNAGYQKSRGDS